MKKHSRKVAIKNYHKSELPKVFGLKYTMNLLSTYRHENFKNICSWQAEKNILLSTYWHKKDDDFLQNLGSSFWPAWYKWIFVITYTSIRMHNIVIRGSNHSRFRFEVMTKTFRTYLKFMDIFPIIMVIIVTQSLWIVCRKRTFMHEICC